MLITGRTYAKYIFLFFSLVKNDSQYMFTYTLSFKFENQWKVIPLNVVSSWFGYSIKHFIMIPFITLFKLCDCAFYDFLLTLFMCIWGLFKSSPSLPEPPSHPPWWRNCCGPHKGSPRPTLPRCWQQYIPVATVVVDVPLVKWFHPPTPVPVVPPITHEGASCPHTTCEQPKHLFQKIYKHKNMFIAIKK